jgi:hypothetical protein
LSTLNKPLPDKISKLGYLLTGIGLLIIICSFLVDKHRGAFDYLWIYMFLVSIGIGGLALTALEYLVGATWSVPYRRVCEFLASIIPLLVVLVIPLIFFMGDLFHWLHPEAGDEILAAKKPYLNMNFFLIRVVFCIIVWYIFYFFFTKNSKKQDITKDPAMTRKNIKLSVVFAPLFFITLTVTAIDWMMSLEPHWYSTMYGVYFFAGTIVCTLAMVTFISINLKENGYLSPRLGNDQFYSLGTLLFGFNIFWGYIAFSQFMLIWYADIPEETYWYMMRWHNGWQYVSLALLFGHFVIPFLVLLPRSVKVNLKTLKVMSVWMVFAHMLDLYWLIMPTYSKSPVFGWQELGMLFFAPGVIMVVFTMKAAKENLTPVGDPKLEAGLNFTL